MKKHEFRVIFQEYDSLAGLPEADEELVWAARKAAGSAYAKYSGFHVGAAIRLDNGKIVAGSNQENAVYPSGLCAERVAVFYSNSQFPENSVVAIAIAALKNKIFVEHPVPPCGACRQVLLETEIRFGVPIRVIMAGEKKIIISDNISNLLPLKFSDRFLSEP